MNMQLLAVGWLAVLLAEADGTPELAPFYIGLLGLARGVPSLALGLVGGVIADRVDRRTLLIISRVVAAAGAGVLAATTLTGTATIVVLMAVTVADAITMAFDFPARTAMLARAVPEASLTSAVGLQNTTMMSSMLIGPLIAGVLIGPLGVGGVMAANALVYLLAVPALIGLPSARPKGGPSGESVLEALVDGLRYVAREPVLRWMVAISAVAGFLARPTQQLLPAFAHEALGVGATELSWLLASAAIGSIAGTAAAASIGGLRRRGLVVALAVIGWGLGNVAFAVQTGLFAAMVLLIVPGVAHWIVSGTSLVLVQTRSPDRYRGRVVSIFMLTVMGLSQIGVLAMGSLGALVGVASAFIIGGLAFAVFGMYIVLRVSTVRDLGLHEAPAGEAVPAGTHASGAD